MNGRVIFLPLAALAVGIGAVGIVSRAPLGTDLQAVIRDGGAERSLLLEPGGTLTQSFRATGRAISGVTLVADAEPWERRALRVRLLDADGSERARGSAVRRRYAEGRMFLDVPFPSVQVSAGERLAVFVSLDRGPALRLRAAARDVPPQGRLTVSGQEREGAVVFSTRHPAPTPDGVRHGVLAGAIFLLGLTVILIVRGDRLRWVLAAVLLGAVTPLALGGFWFSEGSWGISDWDYYFSLHETYRQTILEHRTFPLWNPATGGGTAGIGDPEFPVFTVTFLLELLFGIPLGARLAIFTSVVGGAVGMLALARRVGLSVLPATLAALGVAFSSVNLLEIVEGHVNIFAAMWVPWIFWAWCGAYRRRASPLVCGIFLALMFYAGGIYLLSYTLGAFLVLLVLVRRPLDALRATLVSGLWALGISALKLLPVLFWLREFPDESYAGSAFTLPWLRDILLGRHLHGAEIIERQESGWHEYGAYVGPLLLFLSLLGATRFRRDRIVGALAVSAVAATLLSASGPFLEPVFDRLPYIPRSNISRVILFAVIPLSLLAGHGVAVIQKRVAGGAVLAVVLTGLVAMDLMSLASPLSEQAFVIPELRGAIEPAPEPIAFTGRSFSVERGGVLFSRSYAATLAGYGTLTFQSVLGPLPMVKTIEDEGESRYTVIENGRGEANVLSWTPNRVRLLVSVPEDTKVVINTNFAVGWHANGVPAESVDGRVATPVPAGEREVTFVYRPRGLLAGLLVSAATALAAGRAAFLAARRRGRLLKLRGV